MLTTYVGFLRGLNVGGKNKVNMLDLRTAIETFGYQKITTVGNTGIIIFNTEQLIKDEELANQLTEVIGIRIQLVLMQLNELEKLVARLPDWWNQRDDWRHNTIFFLEEYNASRLQPIVDHLDRTIEQAILIENTLFWSSAFKERKLYYRSQYAKLLKNDAYPYMTIRNANTLNKVIKKAKEINN
ncbi:hypothetical protein IGI67_000576 [Enterococcus sp. AZ196]